MAGRRHGLKNYAELTQGVREEIIKLAKNLSNVNFTRKSARAGRPEMALLYSDDSQLQKSAVT
jgi:hypothetical protein